MIFRKFLAKKKLAFSLILCGFASLFTTTLLIFLTTATWILVLGFLGAFDNILGNFFAHFCFWELPRAPENLLSGYLKRYLKFKNGTFSRKICTAIFLMHFVLIFSSDNEIQFRRLEQILIWHIMIPLDFA